MKLVPLPAYCPLKPEAQALFTGRVRPFASWESLFLWAEI